MSLFLPNLYCWMWRQIVTSLQQGLQVSMWHDHWHWCPGGWLSSSWESGAVMETTVERGGSVSVCLHTQSGWEVKYTYSYNIYTQLEAWTTKCKQLGNSESDQQEYHRLCRDPFHPCRCILSYLTSMYRNILCARDLARHRHLYKVYPRNEEVQVCFTPEELGRRNLPKDAGQVCARALTQGLSHQSAGTVLKLQQRQKKRPEISECLLHKSKYC